MIYNLLPGEVKQIVQFREENARLQSELNSLNSILTRERHEKTNILERNREIRHQLQDNEHRKEQLTNELQKYQKLEQTLNNEIESLKIRLQVSSNELLSDNMDNLLILMCISNYKIWAN